MPSQNKSTIYFPFKGLIWKLLIDQSSSVLVAEYRDEESRKVDFAAIDLVSRKQLWDGLQTRESWWIGLEEARNEKVVLHGYKDIQNPEHQGIYVFDMRKGKLLWENPAYTFFSLEKENLIAYDPTSQERIYVGLSLKDGKVVGELVERDLLAQLSEQEEEPAYIVNSNHYTPENKYFEKIAGFIEAFGGKRAEGAVDYLEFQGKIIVSFYSKEGEKLVNYLLVVSEEGEILYMDAIGTEISGIGMDTFFLYKDLLIFVKDKKELVVFEL